MLKWVEDFKENLRLLEDECNKYTVGLFDLVLEFNNRRYVIGFDGYGGINIRRDDGKYLSNTKQWVKPLIKSNFKGEKYETNPNGCYIKLPENTFENKEELNSFIENLLINSL